VSDLRCHTDENIGGVLNFFVGESESIGDHKSTDVFNEKILGNSREERVDNEEGESRRSSGMRSSQIKRFFAHLRENTLKTNFNCQSYIEDVMLSTVSVISVIIRNSISFHVIDIENAQTL